MTLSYSMWLNRRSIKVVSVLITMFLWSTDAMPQEDCNVGGDTGISSIIHEIERTPGNMARCVPFRLCCDDTDPDNKKEKLFLGLIDVRTGGDQVCGGKLQLCCTCVKEDVTPEPKIPTEKPQDSKGVPNPHQWTCGKRNVDGVSIRVTGFEDGQTQHGEFPWMVAVMGQDTTFIGGGSLVNTRVVLTAGHKVYKKTPESLMARIGDWDISDQIESIDPQNIDVEKILYHPKFNRQKHEFNVAILVLKEEAVYGATVAPVCLPEPGQNFEGKNCFVTGWGKDDFGDKGNYQTIMKKVEVPIVNNNECQTSLRATRLGSDFVLHSSFTCAGGQAEDACTGDGGSPLVCPGVTDPQKLVQVGVVSWGIGCGVVGNPGVYGSVVESIDWIIRTIQNEVGIEIDIRQQG